MMGLIFAAGTGIALLFVFVVLGIQGPPEMLEADKIALNAVGQMLNLGGNAFVHVDRLLDDQEYRGLLSNPALAPVAAQLRKDRRELVLLWISVLLTELNSLWRFRRFVIHHGATTKLSEEFVVFRSFLGAVLVLNLLKLSVFAFGPFAFTRMARAAVYSVDLMSRAAASTLARIPEAGWPDLKRAWAGAD